MPCVLKADENAKPNRNWARRRAMSNPSTPFSLPKPPVPLPGTQFISLILPISLYIFFPAKSKFLSLESLWEML